MSAYALERLVRELHEDGAYHKRRGFSLKDSTPLICTNHLMEEVNELQAEACITLDKEGIKNEAGDVLAILMHFLIMHDIALDDISEHCVNQLQENFVYKEDDIESDNPGFMRRNRND